MEPTLTSAKHFARNACLAGSRFEDVNLAAAEFENVNLAGSRFHDINFSDVTFEGAQIGGCRFRHIGPPPDASGTSPRQRPVSFEEMTLCDSTFRAVDLSNVRIEKCTLDGMTIDGVPVADLLAAYAKQAK